MAEPPYNFFAVGAVRVVSTPEVLDRASWPGAAAVLRIAPDEVLLIGGELVVEPPEPHAIVFEDRAWYRVSLTPEQGALLMEREADWPPPDGGFGQGMVAGVPVKLVVREDVWAIYLLDAFADEFEQRLQEVLT